MCIRHHLYRNQARVNVFNCIIGLFNQKVVGWSMINNLTTESTIISA